MSTDESPDVRLRNHSVRPANGAHAANGVLKNGRAHSVTVPKKQKAPSGRPPGATPPDYSSDFEAFWKAYRTAMFDVGGKAAKNANGMSKPKTFAAWQRFDEGHRAAAIRFIPDHKRDAGEFMRIAQNYLSEIVQNYIEGTTGRDDGRRRRELDALIGYSLGQTPWTQGMKDYWVAPPGDPRSRVPEDLWREAQTLAELQRAKEVPHAA